MREVTKRPKTGYAACRYCGYGYVPVIQTYDGGTTACKACRKKRTEMAAYCQKVEVAARRYYKMVKKGRV